MAVKCENGVYQQENGLWAYRFSILIDGRRISRKKTTDESGNKLKSQKQAIKAREVAIANAHIEMKRKQEVSRRTVKEVFAEYCENGRIDRKYQTIRKQDSLWENHLCDKFGKRFVDDISVAEVNDYLAELYYIEGYSYKYTESFLKMFYLIFGQAYSKDYISAEKYYKLCRNKDTKISMPKMKVDEDEDIKYFSKEENDHQNKNTNTSK